jgi:putative FmdB family regulatory protein
MPTYEYECEKCGYIFDEFQSINAAPLKVCKKEGCGGSVRRLLSGGAGFLLKGSGFYATDYRSESYKKAEKSDAGPSSSAKPSDPAAKPAESKKPSSGASPGTAPSTDKK